VKATQQQLQQRAQMPDGVGIICIEASDAKAKDARAHAASLMASRAVSFICCIAKFPYRRHLASMARFFHWMVDGEDRAALATARVREAIQVDAPLPLKQKARRNGRAPTAAASAGKLGGQGHLADLAGAIYASLCAWQACNVVPQALHDDQGSPVTFYGACIFPRAIISSTDRSLRPRTLMAALMLQSIGSNGTISTFSITRMSASPFS